MKNFKGKILNFVTVHDHVLIKARANKNIFLKLIFLNNFTPDFVFNCFRKSQIHPPSTRTKYFEQFKCSVRLFLTVWILERFILIYIQNLLEAFELLFCKKKISNEFIQKLFFIRATVIKIILSKVSSIISWIIKFKSWVHHTAKLF